MISTAAGEIHETEFLFASTTYPVISTVPTIFGEGDGDGEGDGEKEGE